jgi:branched-chain amino acid transport system ATP-binding protein
MLEVKDLSIRRGALRVVHSVSLSLESGSVVGLLGLNGAGKSSLLECLAGNLPSEQGTIQLVGTDVTSMPAWDRCKQGIVLVPAGRQLFGSLSVRENLLIGGHLQSARAREESLEQIYEMFPVLLEKRGQRADKLSGGQQQMLAVGRGLMARPRLLMLDEPSEGLAPIIVEQMFAAIARLRESTDITILLAEQNAGVVEILDTVLVMENGQITGTSAAGKASQRQELEAYLFGN